MDRLNELYAEVITKALSLSHVDQYLKTYVADKSNHVYNAKISFYVKCLIIFLTRLQWLQTMSPKEEKKPTKDRIRIDIDNYKAMLTSAEHYLSTAMRLALQTTHAINEISSAKYNDCAWLKKTTLQDAYLYLVR